MMRKKMFWLVTWLVVIGWVGWAWSTPVQVIAGPGFSWTEMVTGLMLAVAGAALAALLFSWLTTGQGNALMTARGVLGAVVAASAGLPFVPLWAALAIGAGAGFLVPLVQYLIDHVLRLDDFTSAVAAHLVPGLWGLLAVGVFADGRAGQVLGQQVGAALVAAVPLLGRRHGLLVDEDRLAHVPYGGLVGQPGRYPDGVVGRAHFPL